MGLIVNIYGKKVVLRAIEKKDLISLLAVMGRQNGWTIYRIMEDVLITLS